MDIKYWVGFHLLLNYSIYSEISKQGLQYESYLLRTFRDIPIISNKKLERYKSHKCSMKMLKIYTDLKIENDTTKECGLEEDMTRGR